MLTGTMPGRLKSWIGCGQTGAVGFVEFSISDSRVGHVTRATGVPVPAEASTNRHAPRR